MANQPATVPATTPQGDVVARASKEYRVKRYIMVALLVGWGLWSIYDGYVKYPNDNNAEIRKAEEKKEPKPERLPHTDTDIFLNKLIGWVLPPVGLIVLAMALYNSRGEYRLRGQILNVPGHPPVPFDSIRSIDKTDWDKKGIAYVHYETANGTKGKLRLDDFIYERTPTDEIFKRLEAYAGTGEAASGEPASA